MTDLPEFSKGSQKSGNIKEGELSKSALLSVRGLVKHYVLEGKVIQVLNGVDLDLHEGQLVGLVGKSGAGKSTLLQVLGSLDVPTSGDVRFLGESLFVKSEAELSHFRNTELGFVFQFHYLLPDFTAEENVMMPLLIRRVQKDEAREKAVEVLKRVGMEHRSGHRPSELSGGEQQRVAIARALVAGPRILFLDEPTGNLDPNTSVEIQSLLLELNRELRTTMLLVTHNENFAHSLTFCLRMVDGVLVTEN